MTFLFQRGDWFVGVLVIIFAHFTWNILKSVQCSNSKNSTCFERNVFHLAWICSSLTFSRKCAKPLKSFTTVCYYLTGFLRASHKCLGRRQQINSTQTQNYNLKRSQSGTLNNFQRVLLELSTSLCDDHGDMGIYCPCSFIGIDCFAWASYLSQRH